MKLILALLPTTLTLVSSLFAFRVQASEGGSCELALRETLPTLVVQNLTVQRMSLETLLVDGRSLFSSYENSRGSASVPLEKRISIAKSLNDAGFFMTDAFGDSFHEIMGPYGQKLRAKKNAETPYRDLAHELFESLWKKYFVTDFDLVKAWSSLAETNRTRFDLNSVKSFVRPDASPWMALLFLNSIVEVGSDNMVLIFKEMLIHAGGHLDSYLKNNKQVELKEDSYLSDLEDLKKASGIGLAFEEINWRLLPIIGGGIVTAYGALAATLFPSGIGIGELFIGGALISYGVARIDYLTALVRKPFIKGSYKRLYNRAQKKVDKAISSMEDSTVSLIAHDQLSGKELSTGWDDSMKAIEGEIQATVSLLKSLESSIGELRSGQSHTINLGLLDEATLKANGAVVQALLSLEYELEIGRLSTIPLLSQRLNKVKGVADFQEIVAESQALLNSIQTYQEIFSHLEKILGALRYQSKMYAAVVGASLSQAEALPITEPIEVSIEGLESSLGTVKNAESHLAFVKQALTSFGAVRMAENLGRLSEKLIGAHENLRNSLPGAQICEVEANRCLSLKP